MPNWRVETANKQVRINLLTPSGGVFTRISFTPAEACALAEELLRAAEGLEPTVSGIGALAMTLQPPPEAQL